ncbi:MAG: DUF3881 family protein [Lachnospiraceae bacterium]|nr:DUF3881 family protein [Lachnospiraceae bacterium]
MHKYLAAIGFSQIKNRKDFNKLVMMCINDSTERSYTSNTDDTMLAILSKEFAPGVGLTVCGEYDDSNTFTYEYSYPYLKGTGITTSEDITIERHADKESYAGVCDDINMGITLIFYLQNIIPYIRAKNTDSLPVKGTTLTLSALSICGNIMMPIKKDKRVMERADRKKNSRYQLMQAARNGDEDAIESLTLDDMDMYSTLTKRIQKEDVYTIVDTYFMPYGVECDQYSILAEILECEKISNTITNEELYRMKLLCNELTFDLCINEKDLYGEPAVGRRFKGIIWLQGYINYPL